MNRAAGGSEYKGIAATAAACEAAAKAPAKKPKHKTMEATEMAKKLERIGELRHILWRNIANGLFTSGLCSRGCGAMARGSGVCAACAEKELGELIGKAKAKSYVGHIRAIRKAELEMDNAAEGVDDE